MAICSISSATALVRRRCTRRSMRPAPFSLCRLRRARARRTLTTPPKRPAAFGGVAAPSAEATPRRTSTPVGLAHCSFPALRFHPELFYRDGAGMRRLPALVAAITGNDGVLTGVQRTWLDPRTPAKAEVYHPRKALGRIHGLAVRFGDIPTDSVATLLVGEGIETVLSLITAVPSITAAAALSAEVSAPLRRLPALPASSSPAITTAKVNAPPNASGGDVRRLALKPMSSSLNGAISTMTWSHLAHPHSPRTSRHCSRIWPAFRAPVEKE